MLSPLIASILLPYTLGKSCGFNSFTKLENLVTFGDSLTDDGRSDWFLREIQTNPETTGPPPGTEIPIVKAASGGKAWGRVATEMTGAKYNNYAVSGGTCSWDIVQRTFIEGFPFPSVMDYEVPTYKADLPFENLYPDRRPDNTVYALAIGGNDLGFGGFFDDTQAPGATLSNLTSCFWDVFDEIYETGGRLFVLLTISPFDEAPLYSPADQGGLEYSRFWLDKASHNTTALQQKMRQYISAANTLAASEIPFNLNVQNRWPGASFALFDINRLMLDILASPQGYRDAPENVRDVYRFCEPNEDPMSFELNCTEKAEPLSSFMWFDQIHPSERTLEIVGKNFVDIVTGSSKYAKYWTSE